MKPIGISFGVTSCVAAYCVDAPFEPRILPSRHGELHTPAVVSVRQTRGGTGSHELLVGKVAFDNAIRHPSDTIVAISCLIGRDFEESLVQDFARRVSYPIVRGPHGDPRAYVRMNGTDYLPTQIAAMILKNVADDAAGALGEHPTHAVIAIPAYFEERQRNASREAAEQAGLTVTKLISGAEAAAIAFGMAYQQSERRLVLVYDLGGASFDVSILRRAKRQDGSDDLDLMEIAGDFWLGGDEFDSQIVKLILEVVKRQTTVDPAQDRRFLALAKQAAEAAKRTLSVSGETDVVIPAALREVGGEFVDVDFSLTRAMFEAAVQPYVDRTIELVTNALRNQAFTVDDIDDVLLVGGGTLVPLVRQSLDRFFGSDKIRIGTDPQHCVALGAAVVAAKLALQPDYRQTDAQITVTDVTAAPFGIAVNKDSSPFFLPIIPKGTAYPLSEPKHVLIYPSLDQHRVQVPIYEGWSESLNDNEMQGVLECDLPRDVTAMVPLEFTLTYDENRVLTATLGLLGGESPSSLRIARDRGEAGWELRLLARYDSAISPLRPRQYEADVLVVKARQHIADGNSSEALALIAEAQRLDPQRKDRLQAEFAFLGDLGPSGEFSTPEAECQRRLWRALSLGGIDRSDDQPTATRDRPLAPDGPDSSGGKVDILPPAEGAPRDSRKGGQAPREKGEDLEHAAYELLREFFDIEAGAEDVVLQQLRRERAGNQYGHDISFRCTVRGRGDVVCHVECKNYKRSITPGDVVEKLEQEESHWGPGGLDHWILISPYADASNELNLMLERWRRTNRYSFNIQLWTPETGVQEFFSLSSEACARLYGPEAVQAASTTMSTEEFKQQMRRRWQDRLAPPLRLAKEWESYIRSPHKLCLSGENATQLDQLFRLYVPLFATDVSGTRLPGTLEDHVQGWLKSTVCHSMLILGDFGDGKTVFTYVMARRLAQEYVTDPTGGYIPIRLALRDARPAGSSHEFLRRRLEEFGATLDGWNALIAGFRSRIVVILDGFDEMSKDLAPSTVIANMRLVLDCFSEFSNLKVVLTSRSQFFDNHRRGLRLLERLGSPLVLRIAPIPRRETLTHLERFAAENGQESKLEIVKRLYDPIGIASKPLFLQMIKDTLRYLPEDKFDEVTLYETYVRQSLERKIDWSGPHF